MLRKTILSISAIATCFILMSWGVVGHRAIGKIAETHLTKKARQAVTQLLGSESLAMVSTYPDEIRSYQEFAYTTPWHYVNITPGLQKDQFMAELTRQDTPNVYNAIANCIRDLKDPSKTHEEQVFALKFLVHLVGDIHQPMHLGRSEDLGGNRIQVKLGRREMNMHGLWDSALIDYMGMTYSEVAQSCGQISKQQQQAWQADEVATWAFESYQAAEQLYAEAEANPNFDYTYYPKHADFIKMRIAQAGIRLAGILNEIYQ